MFNPDVHDDTTERDTPERTAAVDMHDDTTERTNPVRQGVQPNYPTNPQPNYPINPQQPYEMYNSSVPTYSQTRWQNAPVQPTVPPQHTPYGYNANTSPLLPVTPSQQTQQPVRKQSRGLRAGAILLLTLLLAVVFGTGLFAGWEFGRGSAAPALTTTTSSSNSSSTTVASTTEAQREAVIAKVRPAIVLVNVTTASGSALGSGEIVNKQGYIVTNNHVVSGANTIQVVLSDGTRAAAQLVGKDAADDLAVIKINPTANLAVITLGDSSQLKVGQEVLAIGNPLGNTQTVTNGIVSALNRNVSEGQGGATIPDAIQTDAPINPGNSGGALVDMSGNLIGVPTLTAIDPEFNTPANGVGFAIPSNRVKLVVPQIIQTGKVTHTGRAVLGVSVASVDSTVATQRNLSVDHGALITTLVNGGAAAGAGLKAGDVILKVDNTTVNDASSLGNALINKNPGDRVAVTINRGGQQQTITVTLGELQAS